MYDVDTFLTVRSVTVDDLSKTQPVAAPRPGKASALCPSEVITLALLSQWRQFESERALYRYALRHLRSAFPPLPERRQFTRRRAHAPRCHRGFRPGTGPAGAP